MRVNGADEQMPRLVGDVTLERQKVLRHIKGKFVREAPLIRLRLGNRPAEISFGTRSETQVQGIHDLIISMAGKVFRHAAECGAATGKQHIAVSEIPQDITQRVCAFEEIFGVIGVVHADRHLEGDARRIGNQRGGCPRTAISILRAARAAVAGEEYGILVKQHPVQIRNDIMLPRTALLPREHGGFQRFHLDHQQVAALFRRLDQIVRVLVSTPNVFIRCRLARCRRLCRRLTGYRLVTARSGSIVGKPGRRPARIHIMVMYEIGFAELRRHKGIDADLLKSDADQNHEHGGCKRPFMPDGVDLDFLFRARLSGFAPDRAALVENVVLEQQEQCDHDKAGRTDDSSSLQERAGSGIPRAVGQVEPQFLQLFVGVNGMQVYCRAAGDHRQDGQNHVQAGQQNTPHRRLFAHRVILLPAVPGRVVVGFQGSTSDFGCDL